MSTAADAGGDKPPARVVVDANTLISAAIGSKKTPPADIYTMVDRALASTTVVIVCPRLLDETERSFSKRKLARLVHPDEVQDVMKWILGGSKLVTDPCGPARSQEDGTRSNTEPARISGPDGVGPSRDRVRFRVLPHTTALAVEASRRG